MMRIVLAIIFFGHGFAHLPGFLVSWQITTIKELPYKTTLLAGRFDLGDTGIRIVGILWLIAALAFAGSAVGALARTSWWLPAAMAAAIFSFVLCLTGWPDSRIGVFLDVAIVAILLVSKQMEWLG